MEKIVFMVRKSEEGGFVASAQGFSIVTEADTREELWDIISDAVNCHFGDEAACHEFVLMEAVK